MADKSHIEWTDATWSPITGCSVVSPGCTNCYAMKLAGTRLKHIPSREGLTSDSKAGPVWNGTVRFNEQWLDQPLRWKTPRMIFVCAHGDLFHEAVPDEWIDQVFAVMALSTQHTFQVLTKRAERMREYLSGFKCDGARRFTIAGAAGRLMEDGDNAHDWVANANWPLPNVWLGVSAERAAEWHWRTELLKQTPAAIRFVSVEPLLGDLGDIDLSGLDWIIVGGESGRDARPMHPAWVRSIRDQCTAAGVPFFFKQWGAWAPNVGAVDGWTIDDDPEISRFDHREWEDGKWSEPFRPMWCDFQDGNYDEEQCVSRIGKKRAGRMLDGIEHNGMPEVREWPSM